MQEVASMTGHVIRTIQDHTWSFIPGFPRRRHVQMHLLSMRRYMAEPQVQDITMWDLAEGKKNNMKKCMMKLEMLKPMK